MNTRTFIATLFATLAPLAKAAGDAPPPAEGTDPAPPQAGEAPPAVAPGGNELASALDQSVQALAALKEEAATNGTVDGLDEKLKTIAGVLLSLTSDGAAAAKRAGDMEHFLAKALLPEVEMGITLSAAREKLYGVDNLLRENKNEEAKAAIQGVISMLNSVSSDGGVATPATPTKGIMKSVSMLPTAFALWATAQLSAAAKEEAPVAQKRLVHLAKRVKLAKEYWEQTGAESKPITVEIEEAYVGTGGGSAQDLTTKGDQKTTEPSINDTGAPDQSNFATNSAEVLGKAVSALLAQFNTNQPDNAVAGLISKNKPFEWPMDVTRADDPPPEAETIAKRDPATDWGRDPWAQ